MGPDRTVPPQGLDSDNDDSESHDSDNDDLNYLDMDDTFIDFDEPNLYYDDEEGGFVKVRQPKSESSNSELESGAETNQKDSVIPSTEDYTLRERFKAIITGQDAFHMYQFLSTLSSREIVDIKKELDLFASSFTEKLKQEDLDFTDPNIVEMIKDVYSGKAVWNSNKYSLVERGALSYDGRGVIYFYPELLLPSEDILERLISGIYMSIVLGIDVRVAVEFVDRLVKKYYLRKGILDRSICIEVWSNRLNYLWITVRLNDQNSNDQSNVLIRNKSPA